MGDFAVHCCFNLFHQPMVHPCDMLLFAVNKKQKNTPKVPKHSYLIIPALWYIACDSSFIPPQSLTWNLKMMVSNRNLLFQWLIFRFHVKLQGCTLNIISLGREPRGDCPRPARCCGKLGSRAHEMTVDVLGGWWTSPHRIHIWFVET